MSILGRMLFLLCLFLLATMTIVGGFSYFNYRENCRMGEYGVQRAALGAANYAQLFLHTAARDVRQLARAPQVLEAVGVLPADMKKGTPLVYEEPLPPAAAALRSLLDMTVYGSHRVLQVGFVDMRGGFMASPSLRVVLDHDPRKRPWFLRALASPGEVARSSYLSSPGNEPVCSFSQAVLDKGQVVGVVYMEVSLHMFSQAMNVLKPGVSGAVYVLDRDGVALAAPGEERVLLPLDGAPSQMRSARDGFYRSDIDGVSSFWAVHSDEYGFRYIVAIDADELLHESNMLLLRSCIGAGLVLLIILVAGYVIAGSAVMPLTRLENAANSIADGRDAGIPDAAHFSGEILGLRNAMSRMVVALRTSAASAQRSAQQSVVNERKALAALREAKHCLREYRYRSDALIAAAGCLTNAAEELAAAEGEVERAARLEDARRWAREVSDIAGKLALAESAEQPKEDGGAGPDGEAGTGGGAGREQV